MTPNQRKAYRKMMTYLPFPEAIRVVRIIHPWWPETSIRDAVREGQVHHYKASLRRKAKIFIRPVDLCEFATKHLTQ